jgi:hypothetical protein
MKTTIALIIFSVFSLNGIENDPKEHPEKYCAKLKDGIKKVIHENAPITSEVILNNGTKIQPDGTIIKKDGSRTILQEGECITKEGVIAKEKDKKDKSK